MFDDGMCPSQMDTKSAEALFIHAKERMTYFEAIKDLMKKKASSQDHRHEGPLMKFYGSAKKLKSPKNTFLETGLGKFCIQQLAEVSEYKDRRDTVYLAISLLESMKSIVDYSSRGTPHMPSLFPIEELVIGAL